MRKVQRPTGSSIKAFRAITETAISRRQALKTLTGFSAGLMTGVISLPSYAQESIRLPYLSADDPRWQASPGKQELISSGTMVWNSGVQTATFPLMPPNINRIIQVSEWDVGHFPNYSDSAYVGSTPFVWVAAFGNRTVTRVNVNKNSSVTLQTGYGTLPLDVAYDRKRNRIVIASADDSATMIVLDAGGNVVAQKRLAYGTGQGPSVGGAQGVAVDGQGNYWFTLAYHGMGDRGVIVKVDGDSHDTLNNVTDVGLHNPNGLIYVNKGPYLIAFSDNGVAHQFGLDGTLQRILETVHIGYRGTVKDGMLWVASWSAKGEMVRIDLETEERREFFCVPLANSITVDSNNHVWVAGDAGLSVSSYDGSLLAMTSEPGFSNGLTAIGANVFHVTSDVQQTTSLDMLKQVALVNVRTLLPGLHSAARQQLS